MAGLLRPFRFFLTKCRIMDDQIRVTGKKIDDLQEAIAALRKASVGIPLQFVNMKS